MMEKLPAEVKCRIAGFFGGMDLVQLATLDKSWREAAERVIWETVSIRDAEFPLTLVSVICWPYKVSSYGFQKADSR